MSISTHYRNPQGRCERTKSSTRMAQWVLYCTMPCLLIGMGMGIGHGNAHAQAAGTGATVSMKLSAAAVPVTGWSVSRGLLGRPLMDDRDMQIGTIIDLVVTTRITPYVLIVGVGGHFDIHGHAVAIPLDSVVEQNGLLHLPGGSPAALRAMPAFSYDQLGKQRSPPR